MGPYPNLIPCTNHEIAERLGEILDGLSYREIAQATGYHSEAVRRYFHGNCKIPAKFIGAVAVAYRIDPAVLLFSESGPESDELPDGMSSGELTDAALTAIRPMLQAWFINVKNNRNTTPGNRAEASGDVEPKPSPKEPSGHSKPKQQPGFDQT